MRFNKFILAEEAAVTQADLDKLERYFDIVFKNIGMEVEFTKHFLERVNDSRNGKQITVAELVALFNKEYAQRGRQIASMSRDQEAVMRDASTEINVPFAIGWNPKTKMLELRSKTIMRKKVFSTPDPVLVVR